MLHFVRAPKILTICLIACLALSSATVLAHDPGLSTATVRLETDKLEAVLVFSVVDVGEIVDLDKDRDGQISKSELADGLAELQTLAPHALDVKFDDQPVTATDTRCRFDQCLSQCPRQTVLEARRPLKMAGDAANRTPAILLPPESEWRCSCPTDAQRKLRFYNRANGGCPG
jgi:hypothetical protein